MATDVRMGCTFASKPKKYCTIPDGIRRLKERLVRKPFSLPTISTVLQELGGFTYATALDLNQVWATKPLDWILTRPESVPSTFHGASTPRSDYRWIVQVLLIYSKRKYRS